VLFRNAVAPTRAQRERLVTLGNMRLLGAQRLSFFVQAAAMQMVARAGIPLAPLTTIPSAHYKDYFMYETFQLSWKFFM
jgi:hypothetical protein